MSLVLNVTIDGEITDDHIQAYNERLAMILMQELGPEQCRKLSEMLDERES